MRGQDHGARTLTTEPSILDLLALSEVGPDLFRADLVYDNGGFLYGGQVAAQALRAAAHTVPADRLPHSLHCYFVRAGDPGRATEYRVERDRDGRSFSSRRVVATQDGRLIFTLSCSFAVPLTGPEQDVDGVPDAESPELSRPAELTHLFSLEGALPTQPFPDGAWPTRVWARSTVALPDDPLVHACVLTYLSDLFTGTAGLDDVGELGTTSLDHAVWFHRAIRLDDWVLMDLVPHAGAAGRGWYTGTVHDASGQLAASLAQEILFRRSR
jgi:acyl-CoA thioesterase-2